MCTPNAYCEEVDSRLFNLIKRRVAVSKSLFRDPSSILEMLGGTDQSIAERVYAHMFDTVRHSNTFGIPFDEKVEPIAEIVGGHARLIIRQALPENQI